MRSEIPTPTELQEKIAPILMECYRARRALTKDEIALIKEATGNPEVKLTIHRESELPNGKWRYTRRRDAEKILALTIWLRTPESAVKLTAVATDAEALKPTKRTRQKPATEAELVTPAIATDSPPVQTVKTEARAKAPRTKRAKPKAQITTEPIETVTATSPPATLEQSRLEQTRLEQSRLEAASLPVTQTPVSSTPTPKPKQEIASQNTSAAPVATTTAQGQLSLW